MWVNSFNVAMEDMYSKAGDEEKPHGGAAEKNKHKEEGDGRRLEEADRKKIAVEL